MNESSSYLYGLTKNFRACELSLSFLTRWSIVLFLDVPTQKLRIIIIILPTVRLDIIVPKARTTNN